MNHKISKRTVETVILFSGGFGVALLGSGCTAAIVAQFTTGEAIVYIFQLLLCLALITFGMPAYIAFNCFRWDLPAWLGVCCSVFLTLIFVDFAGN